MHHSVVAPAYILYTFNFIYYTVYLYIVTSTLFIPSRLAPPLPLPLLLVNSLYHSIRVPLVNLHSHDSFPIDTTPYNSYDLHFHFPSGRVAILALTQLRFRCTSPHPLRLTPFSSSFMHRFVYFLPRNSSFSSDFSLFHYGFPTCLFQTMVCISKYNYRSRLCLHFIRSKLSY